MLKNLIKYDLKSTMKFLVIFYILAIFFSVLTRIFLGIENSLIMDIIGKVFSGVTISMIFNILINGLMRLWIRFKSNFYGDESYLTHTLPVDKKTQYLSKAVCAVITTFTSFIVIALVLFIAYYSKENIELVKSILLPVATAYNSTIVKILLAFLFICFLEITNGLQAGYTGIILGHKKQGAKIGYSVLFGFITYFATQIFIVAIVFIVALFNKDIMNLFYTTEMINVDIIKLLIYLAITLYTLTLVILYFVNLKLFKKGVNVD